MKGVRGAGVVEPRGSRSHEPTQRDHVIMAPKTSESGPQAKSLACP